MPNNSGVEVVTIKRGYAAGLVSVLLLLFVMLSYYIAKHPVNGFDTHVTLFMQSHSWDRFLRVTNAVIASFAFRIIYLVFMLVFILAKRYFLTVFVVAAPASEIITFIIKTVISRPRPSAGAITIYDPSPGFSFVSGHTLEYTILFGFLGILAIEATEGRPHRYVLASFAFLMPLVVGLGRVYSGAHWLTDVLGSYLLGMAILISMVCLLRRAFEPKYRFK